MVDTVPRAGDCLVCDELLLLLTRWRTSHSTSRRRSQWCRVSCVNLCLWWRSTFQRWRQLSTTSVRNCHLSTCQLVWSCDLAAALTTQRDLCDSLLYCLREHFTTANVEYVLSWKHDHRRSRYAPCPYQTDWPTHRVRVKPPRVVRTHKTSWSMVQFDVNQRLIFWMEINIIH